MEQSVFKRHIYNEREHWWFSARREIINSIIQNLKPKKKLSILDFGAGSGTNIDMLCKFGNVDVFEKNNKTKLYLKKKYKNIKKVKILEKIPKNKYDLILAADVVEHIKDDKKIINSFLSHLNEKGYVLITVPAFKFLFSSKDIALKHFRRYDKNNLFKLFKNKYLVKKLSYFNFFLFLPIAFSILILKFKNSKFINYAETTPNIILNYILKKIFIFEKNFLQFINFPFGVSILLLAQKND